MKRALWNSGWIFSLNGEPAVPVELPHDAMQFSGRAPGAPSGNGSAHYLGGKYAYEKAFILTEQEASKAMQLQFDGVYRNASVQINGIQVASVPYGYLPFFANCTGLVHPGKNVIRVEADNSKQPSSRWYSGGGIYRSVWLWTGAKHHIAPLGVRVTTLSCSPARIQVQTAHTDGEIHVEIWDGETLITQAVGDTITLDIPDAKLWSAQTPHLYRCLVRLYANGSIMDTAEQMFGIRSLHYDKTGFYVNCQRTMLQGGCLHHDNGILGAVSIPEAEERRLNILKKAGFNAIRCSHNPASSDLLDACDRLGIYVMEEMWDMWYQRKNKYDYGADFPANWQRDVEAVVNRDYSHPCVIMYSIGNEVTEPHNAQGIQQGQDIVALFHRLDPTRPTTIGLNMALVAMSAMGVGLFDKVDEAAPSEAPAINSTVFNETVSRNNNLVMASCKEEVDALTTPILDAVDIAGYNYGAPRYPLDAEKHPRRVVVGSETFPHQLASTWRSIQSCPYVIGDFMWTAWDYLGECSIGAWTNQPDALAFSKPYPWKLADAGAFDLLGNPTGEALWASAVWKGETSIGVRPVPYPADTLARGAWRGTNAIPSWSWDGCNGKMAEVEVYTPGKEAALYCNGVLIGRKATEDLRAMFSLPYAPGKLEAVAYDETGKQCGYAALSSAAGDLHWNIRQESEALRPGQVAFFSVTLEDPQGAVESNRDTVLSMTVTGGTLLGFGSAAPRTKSEFGGGQYPSWYGRALAAVRIGNTDKITIQLNNVEYQFTVD